MVLTNRGRRSTRLLTAVGAAVLAVTLGACASSTPTTPSATGTTSAAASPSSAASSSGPAKSESSSPTGTSGTTTLTGTLTEGVESGCVVLTDAAGAVLANLLGLDTKAPPIGSAVEVTGEFETDVMTTCQQGQPFTVTTVVVQK